MKYSVTLSLALIIVNVCLAQTETKIQEDSLPSIIHDELHKKYAHYTVNTISKNTDKLQSTIYKVEVQKKSTLIELHYDIQGKLINKKKSKVYTYDGVEKPKPPSLPNESNDGHRH